MAVPNFIRVILRLRPPVRNSKNDVAKRESKLYNQLAPLLEVSELIVQLARAGMVRIWACFSSVKEEE